MKTIQIIMTGLMMNISLIGSSNTNNSDEKLTIHIIEITNPTCNSSSNGKITIEPEGGKAPYTFDWNTYPNQTAPTAINLSSGIYFIEVTDANGNIYFESIELSAPETITPNENAISPDVNSPVVNLEFSMTGGNAPYKYELNGVALSQPAVENLSVGIHALIITDANNCSMIQYITVFEIEGENQIDNLIGWTIFNQEPSNDSTQQRVMFSELYTIEVIELEEDNLYANE